MQTTAEHYGSAVILNVKGELTEDSLHAFRQAVDHQLNDEGMQDLVLNLEEVPFIDSAGLEYLLDVGDTLAEKMRQLRLAKLDENVATIIEITRLKAAFEIFDEVQDAIRALQV